jgi:hypothetical protein
LFLVFGDITIFSIIRIVHASSFNLSIDHGDDTFISSCSKRRVGEAICGEINRRCCNSSSYVGSEPGQEELQSDVKRM